MRTTILTLSLLVCWGAMVYSYPGRYEIARQQQGSDVDYEIKIVGPNPGKQDAGCKCLHVSAYNMHASHCISIIYTI